MSAPPGSSDPVAGRETPAPPGTGALGVKLFIASLGMLFAATLAAYLAVRLKAADWPPPGMPRLPWFGLLFSTAVLVVSSLWMRGALKAVRAGDRAALVRFLRLTLGCGFLFLICQAVNWWSLIQAHLTAATNLYGFTFFVLTGLHALHVIGGLVVLIVVTGKAARGLYSPSFHPGVSHASLYWHFLDIVWIVMFLLMFIFT